MKHFKHEFRSINKIILNAFLTFITVDILINVYRYSARNSALFVFTSKLVFFDAGPNVRFLAGSDVSRNKTQQQILVR